MEPEAKVTPGRGAIRPRPGSRPWADDNPRRPPGSSSRAGGVGRTPTGWLSPVRRDRQVEDAGSGFDGRREGTRSLGGAGREVPVGSRRNGGRRRELRANPSGHPRDSPPPRNRRTKKRPSRGDHTTTALRDHRTLTTRGHTVACRSDNDGHGATQGAAVRRPNPGGGEHDDGGFRHGPPPGVRSRRGDQGTEPAGRDPPHPRREPAARRAQEHTHPQAQ